MKSDKNHSVKAVVMNKPGSMTTTVTGAEAIGSMASQQEVQLSNESKISQVVAVLKHGSMNSKW